MSTPPTGQPRDAQRLLRWMFVGRPPNKPPGRVDMALVLLGFVAYCVITAFTWGAMLPLLTLAFFGLWLSVILGRLGNLAYYHRWKRQKSLSLRKRGHCERIARVRTSLGESSGGRPGLRRPARWFSCHQSSTRT